MYAPTFLRYLFSLIGMINKTLYSISRGYAVFIQALKFKSLSIDLLLCGFHQALSLGVGRSYSFNSYHNCFDSILSFFTDDDSDEELA